MHITVFGASGAVGSRVVQEAVSRGHQVRAVARNAARLGGLPAGVEVRAGDVSDPEQVAELSAGSDLVISATRPVPGREQELAEVAAAVLEGLAHTGTRLLVVGGSGSLTVPGTDTTVIELPDFPVEVLPVAVGGNRQLEVFRAAAAQANDGPVDWAYLSPSAVLEPGRRTGAYRLGTDELIVDEDGNSSISMEDLAVVLLDEAELPKHHRTRFTAGY
ncbi:NAD(P)-dependent oxidoreductase [Nocardia stercoris]|uniref:NAD-dependent epimerase/dehydratase family protein n=1 Tax=Nocardia stercoris TaxID=2483361 RepID=A0A3M2L858_9NOCA|nr:NAD(P)H-binding protein [Nocardia stercoris]RMI33206.1 NAD-dependent epimerase/dehydratase family protein [Nocardia stercoris]